MVQCKDIGRARAGIVTGVIAVCVLVLDRLTKAWAVSALGAGTVKTFIPGVIGFRLLYNEGAAWGIFAGATWYFLVLAAVIVAAIVVYLARGRHHSALESVALGLFLAGAVGNAIDRAVAGEVTDFIMTLFMDFPIFNIADCGITVGAILFVLSVFLSAKDAA